MIKGVVFDLDGVLVDAVEWHYLSLNRALSLFGYQIKNQEHQSLYNGLPTAVKLELLTQRKGLPKSLHGFINEMKQMYTRQIIDTSCA
ncbi:MAG: HAD family phosphatase, partial [Deltaproteobacteria bacterium]|nr:HAD family phosphatase [Deltaproteobacteria bacterium]